MLVQVSILPHHSKKLLPPRAVTGATFFGVHWVQKELRKPSWNLETITLFEEN